MRPGCKPGDGALPRSSRCLHIPPTDVEVAVSPDGKNWTTAAAIHWPAADDFTVLAGRVAATRFPALRARYVRLAAHGIGVCPPGHTGAGGKAWLFTDEIVSLVMSMNFSASFRQFRILSRHFFLRLFYNDLLKFEDQQRETQITLLALFTVFSGLVAHVAFEPFLLYQIYGMTPADLWRYEALLLTFSMASTGVIAVASWDKLFLDDLDRAHLRPLPVQARTFFLAKAMSLLAFIFAGDHDRQLRRGIHRVRRARRYARRTVHRRPGPLCGHHAGQCFYFSIRCPAPGAIVGFSPARIGQAHCRLRADAAVVRFPVTIRLVPHAFPLLPAFKAAGATFFRLYPPLWFTGIYNRIIGVRDPVFDPAGRIGLAAAVLAFLSYLLISPFCLKKFLRDPDAKPATWRGIHLFPAGKKLFGRLFLRHPLETAVFSFFMQTLRRSRSAD